MTRSEAQTANNRQTWETKINHLNTCLMYAIQGEAEREGLKLGNGDYTAEELKLKAKQFFIKEVSRQLTNLL